MKKTTPAVLNVSVLKVKPDSLFVKDRESGDTMWLNLSKFAGESDKENFQKIKVGDDLVCSVSVLSTDKGDYYYINRFKHLSEAEKDGNSALLSSSEDGDSILSLQKKFESEVQNFLVGVSREVQKSDGKTKAEIEKMWMPFVNLMKTFSLILEKMNKQLALTNLLLQKSLLDRGLFPEEKKVACASMAKDILVQCVDRIVEDHLKKNPGILDKEEALEDLVNDIQAAWKILYDKIYHFFTAYVERDNCKDKGHRDHVATDGYSNQSQQIF